jgi:hypothetical protein
MAQTEEERKQRRREINKKWRENNVEKFKESKRKYISNNREHWNELCRKNVNARYYYDNSDDKYYLCLRKMFAEPITKKTYFSKKNLEKIDLDIF